MAKCAICGKGRQHGHNVSHAKNRTAKIFKPNIHKATIKGKTMKLCRKCLRRQKTSF